MLFFSCVYGSSYLIQDTNQLINPIFDSVQNSIRIELSNNLSSKEYYSNINLIYAQPNRIFRLPGRINIEIGFYSPPPNKSHYFAIIGISQDLALPIYPSIYGNLFLGVGIGIYLKSRIDDRIGSAVTFGERFFIGYMIKNFDIEIYYKHYSNGTLEKPNGGYDLWGISFGYCF